LCKRGGLIAGDRNEMLRFRLVPASLVGVGNEHEEEPKKREDGSSDVRRQVAGCRDCRICADEGGGECNGREQGEDDGSKFHHKAPQVMARVLWIGSASDDNSNPSLSSRRKMGGFRRRTPILLSPDPFPGEEFRTEGIPSGKTGRSSFRIARTRPTQPECDGPALRKVAGHGFEPWIYGL